MSISARKLLVLPAMLAAALGSVFSSASAAGPPGSASGTYLVTGAPTITDIHTAGSNTFITESFPFVYTGDLNGSSVLYVTVHYESDGSATAHGRSVCTGCTIGDRTGDFATSYDAQLSQDGQVKGTLTVLSATGDLTGLRAVDHFAGNLVTGTYTYSYTFEP
jgi:hypothetical protein